MEEKHSEQTIQNLMTIQLMKICNRYRSRSK